MFRVPARVHNSIQAEIRAGRLNPSDLDGRTLTINVTQEACQFCMQGIRGTTNGNAARGGIIKQFSMHSEYRGITLVINGQGGRTYRVRNGRLVND